MCVLEDRVLKVCLAHRHSQGYLWSPLVTGDTWLFSISAGDHSALPASCHPGLWVLLRLFVSRCISETSPRWVLLLPGAAFQSLGFFAPSSGPSLLSSLPSVYLLFLPFHQTPKPSFWDFWRTQIDGTVFLTKALRYWKMKQSIGRQSLDYSLVTNEVKHLLIVGLFITERLS